MTQIQIDYTMMGIWLRTSPELRAQLVEIGHVGVAYAKSIAPVGQAPGDKHPGAYRDGITAEIHQGKTRMSLRIGSRDQKTHWVEFGSKYMPKYGVLRRTLDHLRGIV